MKKLLIKIYIIISILFILWFAISTVEVALKNTTENPQYSPINCWTIIFNHEQPKVESKQYTAYGRYYTNGTVITNDGNEWNYNTDSISDKTPTDNMPVWIAFDDNGTPDSITDDIILGLVYDRETAIYDALETELGDDFQLERDGNNIRIQTLKRGDN